MEMNMVNGKMEMKISRSEWYLDHENLVVRWCSNDNIPPEECINWLYDHNYIGIGWRAKSHAVREQEVDAMLENYRKQMENHVPDEEEMYELRAAFGAEARIVNVITGKVMFL